MTDGPLRFEHLARRFGPTYETRIYGSPLEPWVEARDDTPAHQSWFVGGRGGEVGALWHSGALYLAVGRRGAGWRLDGGSVTALTFDLGTPDALRNEPDDPPGHTVLFERRKPLEFLSYCRVEPADGQRFLLSSGLTIDISELDAAQTAGELIDAIAANQPEPERGVFARLIGAAKEKPQGAVLILDCQPDESAPPGFLAWLAFHHGRGVDFGWMGNEGGGGLHTCAEPGPIDDIERALLSVLENNPEVREGLFEGAWEEWREYGQDEPGFTRLIEAAPQRGFWRRLELAELTRDLNGRAADYLRSGTSEARLVWEHHIPGVELVERMSEALVEPLALALHQVPSDESVVVWFAIGGVSKSSGQLEVMLVERVWS